MNTFERMLKEGTREAIREERELRYKLADACLAHFDEDDATGRDVYSALSHLAKIPELEINMAHYDNLMFVDNALVSPEIFYFARSKLYELDELLKES